MRMDEMLRQYEVPSNEPTKIVRLARSLHRMGIKRRQTGIPFYVSHGERNCRDARDMVSFARAVANAN